MIILANQCFLLVFRPILFVPEAKDLVLGKLHCLWNTFTWVLISFLRLGKQQKQHQCGLQTMASDRHRTRPAEAFVSPVRKPNVGWVWAQGFCLIIILLPCPIFSPACLENLYHIGFSIKGVIPELRTWGTFQGGEQLERLWSDYSQNSVDISPLGHFTGLVEGVAVIPLYLLTFATNCGVQSHCWKYEPQTCSELNSGLT